MGFYTHEHEEIIRSSKKLIDEAVNPYVDQWEEEGIFPAHEVFKKFGNMGFLGIHKPTEYGGLGLDYSYNLAFAESLSHINCGGVPMAIGVQTDMATPALSNHGSDELRRNFLAPAIADLNNDGVPEVINGSSGNSLHAFGFQGAEPDGWAKPTGQWIIASPTVGDADGDGFLDVWTATRSGYLFAWKTDGIAATAVREWTSFRHDPANTGNCHTELRSYPALPPDVVDDIVDAINDCADCSSTVGPRGLPGGLMLVLLGALAGIRRRR